MADKKTKQRLGSLLKRLVVHRFPLVIILFCLIFTGIATFLQPLIIQRITDDGMATRNFSKIIWFALLLLVISGLEEIFMLIQSRLFVELQNNIQLSLYGDSFRKLLHLKSDYFIDKNSAEIVNQITSDVSTMSTIADRAVLYFVSFLLSIIGGMIGLLMISWKMALIVMLVLPIKYLITKIMSLRQEQITEKYIKLLTSFSAWFGDHINGIREIKLWNLQQRKFDEFIKQQKDIVGANKEMTMNDAGNTVFNGLIERTIKSILYIAGGFLLCKNELTIGGVIAFIAYSGQVIAPISAILQIRMLLAQISPAMNRLFDFLELDEEKDEGKRVIPFQTVERIAMDSVTFGYDEGRQILEKVTFSAKRGEKVAIIGANGSGKTTIINLLLRFYNPQSGVITINGVDAGEFRLGEYRDLFSVVSQDPYLFQDLIRNNIDLCHKSTEEEIQAASRKSGFNSFISNLPNGLNSLAGQDGANLSGGEKQKVAVARAIIKDAPIVIFDEATSNFDVESDMLLHNIIMQEFEEKILILITHNYKNLSGFNRIYQLTDGKLKEVELKNVFLLHDL
ncbi:ABC transporter ATP-binding protein/permease [[Clostridium] hylemonae]|uniref:ABC transporter ATP-binding protein n=2 Tax=[Clostridium] hylemonae TaxID=89153 RepID=UPI001D089287|nr:ABC transporter ATP-binding protein [[Clostridium] hylemonae]MCB7522592.1 ABC transporter ATP-binding protein/permease [[Clostridium] hylemonae]